MFTELFNFIGHEIYIARPDNNRELYEKLTGKNIRQINGSLTDSTAIGIIQENGKTLIDDPNKVILRDDCQLILIQDDDNTVIPDKERKVNFKPPVYAYEPEATSILIIGCNEKLPYILREMCEYLTPGTIVYLSANPEDLDRWLTDDIIEEMLERNIDSAVRIQRADSGKKGMFKARKEGFSIDNYKDIYNLLEECKPQYVLTLTSDNLEDDKADEQALKLLLYCKDFKDRHPEVKFGITCEMRSILNQQLAQDSMASDFVISRNIASLMMSQIAENRELREIFEILLSSQGFEIYMKPARYYFSIESGKAIDFFSVQDAVAEKGEIFIGYKKKGPDIDQILLNPMKVKDGKRKGMVFSQEDELIVLAMDMEIASK